MSGKVTSIKQLRTILKMTQQEFSKIVGVSQAQVSRWEHDEDYPCGQNMRKIIGLASRKKIDFFYY